MTLIDAWLGPRGSSGVAAAIWSDGKLAATRYGGEAQPGQPVTRETLFPLASVTKPVIAAAVMTLIDRGELSLDEPVARHLPAFRASGVSGGGELEPLRQQVTIRQLLAHTSGLPEDRPGGAERWATMQDRETLETDMARLPLLFPPGERVLYSNAGYGVLSLLVQRVTGRDVWDLARERVFQPLGMTTVTAQPDDRAPVARLQDAANGGTDFEAYNSAYWRSLALPWAGLYGNPEELVRFAGAFLSPGEPLLSGAARRLMMTDQAGGVPGGVESARVSWSRAYWGLGWEVKGGKTRHWTGDLTSPATICHFGQAGTLLWADPAANVALAVFANRAVSHMWTFILPAWARLSNAVIAAATADR